MRPWLTQQCSSFQVFFFYQFSQRQQVGFCFNGCQNTYKNYFLVSTSIENLSTEHPMEESTNTLQMKSSLLSSMLWYTSVLHNCSILSGSFPVAGAMEVSYPPLFLIPLLTAFKGSYIRSWPARESPVLIALFCEVTGLPNPTADGYRCQYGGNERHCRVMAKFSLREPPQLHGCDAPFLSYLWLSSGWCSGAYRR